MTAATTRAPIPIAVRVGLEQDVRFVVSTWAKSMRGIYPNQYAFEFYQRIHADIRAHIDRANTLIAYLEDEPEEIVAYLVFLRRRQHIVAHFAYTKEGARREGHLSTLLELANPDKLPLTFTHPARNENAMRHFVSRAIFDPSLWTET
jgi:hypothetical protein